MIEQILVMAWYGSSYGGGMISDALNQWADAGLFAYILPFLLIFAIVYGILDRINVFDENKGINALIALSIGLLSIQMDFVPWFFSELFPRFGVGLILVLISLIFLGLYLDPDKNNTTTILIIAGAVLVGVVAYTSDAMGFELSNYGVWENLPTIIILVILAVFLFSAFKSSDDNDNKRDNSVLGQLLRGTKK